MSSLRTVDAVCIFSESTPLELIKKVRPQVLVKGGDWPAEKIVGRKEVESWGGKVLSLSFVEGHSTTSILDKNKKTLGLASEFGAEFKAHGANPIII